MQKAQGTAFVLKKQDYLDNDLILTVFSLEEGLFTALVKGARKQGNKWRNQFIPFSEIDCEYIIPRVKTSLRKLTKIETRQNCLLNCSPEKLMHFAFVAELLIRFCPSEQKMQRIFDLLQNSFQELSTTDNSQGFLLVFVIKFFTVLGYFPCFSTCGECGKKIPVNSAVVWKKSLLCSHCSGQVDCNLSFTELKILAFFQNQPFEHALKVSLNKEVFNKLFYLAQKEFMVHSPKPLKTLGVLYELA